MKLHQTTKPNHIMILKNKCVMNLLHGKNYLVKILKKYQVLQKANLHHRTHYQKIQKNM